MDRSKVAYTVKCAVWWMVLLSGLADCMTVQEIPRCFFSRLDSFPCNPRSYTSTPGANQYGEYRTRIRYLVPDCIYRNPNFSPLWEIIRPIDTLGNPNIRLLYSPGFTSNKTYKNELLVSYNVQCPAGRLPFLKYIHLDLQPADCFDRCEDYVNVSCAGCGVSESCGTEPTDNSFVLVEEHFDVTFRSSESQRYSGFELMVTCFDPMEIPNGDGDISVSRKKRNLDGLIKVWQKHAAQVIANAVLADLEVAQLPTEVSPLRFLNLNITLGDIITYDLNMIIVQRREQMITRIRNIRRLSIHDRIGGDQTYFIKAVMWNELGERTLKQLRGVGHITVFSDEAHFFRYYEYIQLTPQEQEVLRKLGDELFDLIPRENSDDFEDEPDNYDYDEYMTNYRPKIGTIQRAVPDPPPPRRPVSMSAIHTSITYENSANPVIRAAAASVMDIAEHQDPTRVAEERKRTKDITSPKMIQSTKSEYGEDTHSTFAPKMWWQA